MRQVSQFMLRLAALLSVSFFWPCMALEPEECRLPEQEVEAFVHYLRMSKAFAGKAGDFFPTQSHGLLEYFVWRDRIVWYIREKKMIFTRDLHNPYSFGDTSCYGTDGGFRECLEEIARPSAQESESREMLAEFRGSCRLWLRPEQMAEPWAPSEDSELKRRLLARYRDAVLSRPKLMGAEPLLVVARDFNINDSEMLAVVVYWLCGEIVGLVQHATVHLGADPGEAVIEGFREVDLQHEEAAQWARDVWKRPLLLYPVLEVKPPVQEQAKPSGVGQYRRLAAPLPCPTVVRRDDQLRGP